MFLTMVKFNLFRLFMPEQLHFLNIISSVWSSPAQGEDSWRLDNNLNPNTTYYWRARLICGSERGTYVPTWSFISGSGGSILPGPSLISPHNSSTTATTRVKFEWNAIDDAVEYKVWYHYIAGGPSWTFYNWVQTTSYTVELSPGSTIEWGVQARNDYAIGNSSSTWTFYTPP
jgi:hypothetical protein